jgi:hypothetical protein
MNRFLADTLSGLNVILAVLIVLGCTVQGYRIGDLDGLGIFGLAFGVVVGLVIASLTCGIIALLTLIEGHLAYLTRSADYEAEMSKITLEAIDALRTRSTDA